MVYEDEQNQIEPSLDLRLKLSGKHLVLMPNDMQ